jgi:hypothetical protein
MGLTLSMQRPRQVSTDPVLIELEHNGEKIYIHVWNDKMLRISFYGSKSFKIKRTTLKEINAKPD